MGRSINRTVLLGNLGKQAETTFTPSGIACTKFSIATERSWKDSKSGEWKKETDWHNVVLWRQEKVAALLKKGTKVYIEGRLQTRKWESRDRGTQYVTEVIAEDIILYGDPAIDEGGDSGQPRSSSAPAAPAAQQETWGDITDDDVPF